MLKTVEKLFNRDLAFIDKETWKLELDNEKDLQYELESNNKSLEKDKAEFEKDLGKEDDIIRPVTDELSSAIFSYDNKLSEPQSCILSKHTKDGFDYFSVTQAFDIIDTIYIRVKKDCIMDKVLDNNFRMYGGGLLLISTYVSCLVLVQSFYDKHIIDDENDDYYQIPILDFNMMANNKDDFQGFPLRDVYMSEISVSMYHLVNDLDVIITGRFIKNYRNNKPYDCLSPYFPYSETTIYEKEDYIRLHLYKDIFSKAIVLSLLGDYTPQITSATIEGDGEYVEWDEDEILSVTILDRKFFILPLCKQFSTWENIIESFKDVDNKILKTPFYNNKWPLISFNTDIEIQDTFVQIFSIGFELLSVEYGKPKILKNFSKN